MRWTVHAGKKESWPSTWGRDNDHRLEGGREPRLPVRRRGRSHRLGEDSHSHRRGR
jgi:hypothetical protein